jgi:hypothetical protein
LLGQRHGDPHSLALPAGKLVHVAFGQLAHMGSGQGVGYGSLIGRAPAFEKPLMGVAASADQLKHANAFRGDGRLRQKPKLLRQAAGG